MKIQLPIALTAFICLFASAGQAQMIEETKPNIAQLGNELAPNLSNGVPGSRAQYDKMFTVDMEGVIGSPYLLGVEFDGTDWWVTDAIDFANTGIHQVDFKGTTVINTYNSGHSGWGWRDLAFDGTYLYGSASVYYVDIIDPTNGMIVGSIPTPIAPARALAYDPATDTFWTASWNSDIYNFDRWGNVLASYPNILTGVYGMAWDDRIASDPILWMWSQDGSGCQCTGFHPIGGGFGPTWNGDPSAGMAGGAAFFWTVCYGYVFAGLHQGTPDVVCGYQMEAVSTRMVDIKVNGGDENVSIPLGTNVKIDIVVNDANFLGPADVIVVLKPDSMGFWSYNVLSNWQPGIVAHFTGAGFSMTETVLDWPIPFIDKYMAYLIVDINPNGVLDIPFVLCWDEVGFKIE